MRNIIMSAMGQREDVRVDIGRIRIMPGDKLLVCCDGLSNELTAHEIYLVLAETLAPSAACAKLIALANDHGGRDNITVVVAIVVGALAATP